MKLSKYTVSVQNANNEWIFYNSFAGPSSLCKVPEIIGLKLCSPKDINTINPLIMDSLRRKGHLVSDFEDENAKLLGLYLGKIGAAILNLIILPTEKCNFKCRYCYEEFELGFMNKKCANSIVSFVQKNIHKYNSMNVMWFGGEPLLEQDLIQSISEKLMKICHQNHKIYSAQITTNGYMLTTETFSKLLEFGIREFQITLDGIQRTHDSGRILANGNGTFDVIYNNLVAIKKKFHNKRFQIIIRTNLSQSIIPYVNEYIDACNSLTKNDNRLHIDIQFVRNWNDKASQLSTAGLLEDFNMVNFYDMLLNAEQPLKNIYIGDMFPGGAVCPSGRHNCFLIRPNGDIHKCSMFFNDSKTLLGNISDYKPSILKSAQYCEWLTKWDGCGKMSECSFAPICFGDYCPAQRLRRG